jgi:hypothetical protein
VVVCKKSWTEERETAMKAFPVKNEIFLAWIGLEQCARRLFLTMVKNDGVGIASQNFAPTKRGLYLLPFPLFLHFVNRINP